MSTTTLLHPIFAAFLSQYRKGMATPFRIGQHVYATDGIVIVRTVSGDRDWRAVPDAPPADILDWPHPENDLPITAVALPDIGSGEKVCDACGGTGKWVDFDGEPADLPCEECDGTKVVPDHIGVRLVPALILSRYSIARLRKHDVNAVWVCAQKHGSAGYFKGDGFEGIVMGKRPNEQDVDAPVLA